jgi:hypothetical protein
MSSYGYDSGLANMTKIELMNVKTKRTMNIMKLGIIPAKTENIPRQNVMVSKTI